MIELIMFIVSIEKRMHFIPLEIKYFDIQISHQHFGISYKALATCYIVYECQTKSELRRSLKALG